MNTINEIQVVEIEDLKSGLIFTSAFDSLADFLDIKNLIK